MSIAVFFVSSLVLLFCTYNILFGCTGLANCSVVVSAAVVQNLAVHLNNDTENFKR